jgi:hypothetical protein
VTHYLSDIISNMCQTPKSGIWGLHSCPALAIWPSQMVTVSVNIRSSRPRICVVLAAPTGQVGISEFLRHLRGLQKSVARDAWMAYTVTRLQDGHRKSWEISFQAWWLGLIWFDKFQGIHLGSNGLIAVTAFYIFLHLLSRYFMSFGLDM